MSLIAHTSTGAWALAAAALEKLPPGAAEAALSATAGPASWMPLHFAAASASAPASLLDALLEAGATIDARASSGSTPLHLAAWHGCVEHVAQLVKNGASVTAVTRAGRGPLHFAARRGHAEVIQTLVAAGADVNQTDSKGMSGLHFASEGGHVEAARALMEEGALVMKADDGRTAQDVARGDVLDVLGEGDGGSGVGRGREMSDLGKEMMAWGRGGRLVSALTMRARDVVRVVWREKEVATMSCDEVAEAMWQHAARGQDDAIRREYEAAVVAGVMRYRLSGAGVVAQRPDAEKLVRDVVGVEDGGLFYACVDWVERARLRESGEGVGKEVYAAVGAGVLCGLLLPIGRK